MNLFGVTLSGDDLITVGVFSGVALLLWLVAAFLGSRALRVRRQAAAGEAWPATQGTVLFSQVQEHRSTNNSGGTSYSYSALVQYQYSIAGQEYRSNNLDFSDLGMGGWQVSGGYKQAEAKAAQFAVGRTVPVYYNPENPAEAVLEKKSSGQAILVIGTILVAAFGCGMFIGQFFIVLR